jgi:3-phosphoshikimate 1-carboxyvinyltransferase
MANMSISQLKLRATSHAEGRVTLPGSKSLSNRVLLLAALAAGTTRVQNLLVGDDVQHMCRALRALGVQLDPAEPDTHVAVTGHGGPIRPRDGNHQLFLGNAGTGIRPLAAALCFSSGLFELDGEPRMRERPIADLVTALRTLGARIDYVEREGYPPVLVRGRALAGGSVTIAGNVSSQFLTSLLMAAPLAQNPVEIQVTGELVSKPYITITLDTMRRFGVEVEHDDLRHFRVPAGVYQSPGDYLVEGDASAATYFLAAGAIAGGPVRVQGVGRQSVQGDVSFTRVLERMGATVEVGNDWIQAAAPRGRLQAIDMDFNAIPDAAMTAAVMALFAKGTSVIRNVANLRVKETDRIQALTTELTKLGAHVVAGDDYLEITPPDRLTAATIDTYNDHRMAMSFSLASLGTVDIAVRDPGCVSKTFPGYFDAFRSICVPA